MHVPWDRKRDWHRVGVVCVKETVASIDQAFTWKPLPSFAKRTIFPLDSPAVKHLPPE